MRAISGKWSFCFLLIIFYVASRPFHGRIAAAENGSVLPDEIRLSVARSQTNATLVWPLSDSPFVLESATSLESADWRSISAAWIISAGHCQVTVPLENGQRYFRLRSGGAFAQGATAGDGYITAVLRSECTSAPTPPPPVGETVVGPDYVIKTVARGDPMNYAAAQQVVTDAVFESLMPLYCGLRRSRTGCVTNRVQWNLVTYDATGAPRISGGPTSGPAYHYCAVTNGYITAIVAGESATLPPLPPVGQIAIGTDAVVMTIADRDPTDLAAAQQLATDAVFESLMRRYCAQPRGSGTGQVSGRVRWTVATYDSAGNATLSGCALSGCDVHECVVSRGFITAVLRSECTDAPTPPPPVGGVTVGPDYVMMTVADRDPLDIPTAQQFATDAVFETLMPLYCALAQNPTRGCVRNRVQWNLITYDAGGNAKVSSSPTSGPAFHYFDSCSLTPQERIENLILWVNVDETAGILSRHDAGRLTRRLDAARRQLNHGQTQRAIDSVNRFIAEVAALDRRDRLPAAAAQTLSNAAQVLVTELRTATGSARHRRLTKRALAEEY